MRVLCLSVERGVVLGQRFSPVIYEGCWVGEAEVTDEVVLARMARMPQFKLVGGTAAQPLGNGTGTPQDKPVGYKPVVVGTLPDDYPSRELLIKAGFDTVHDVRAASDDQLLALNGLGAKTLEAIRAYA